MTPRSVRLGILDPIEVLGFNLSNSITRPSRDSRIARREGPGSGASLYAVITVADCATASPRIVRTRAVRLTATICRPAPDGLTSTVEPGLSPGRSQSTFAQVRRDSVVRRLRLGGHRSAFVS